MHVIAAIFHLVSKMADCEPVTSADVLDLPPSEDLERVLSDVHMDTVIPNELRKRKDVVVHVVSRFPFHLPMPDDECVTKGSCSDVLNIETDDKDMTVARRKGVNEVIYMKHAMTTLLTQVGLQLWKGSLYLADYILNNTELFSRCTVLDLGAGIGFCSLIAGMYSQLVYATDLNKHEILDLCGENLCRNSHLLKGKVKVREFDWTTGLNYGNGEYEWSNEDVEYLKKVDIIIASDVIYNNDLTVAFLKSVQKVLGNHFTPKRVRIFVSLEKRINFTIQALASVSPAYNFFVSCVTKTPHPYGVVGQPLVENINQHFVYERTTELEIWELKKI